ncbi:hypothetical protein ACTD5D_09495 [Nocardia takedensis]|uniref:hypothetical protein n=1 Tax=Nocardia takedensis TaxID=259390 RepID=UPI003F770682
MRYDRAEMEWFWHSWLDLNRHARRTGEWTLLADRYTAEAIYSWIYADAEATLLHGRERIREFASRRTGLGSISWGHRHRSAVLDDNTGYIASTWCGPATFTDPSGNRREALVRGCSWFHFDGVGAWIRHRDTITYPPETWALG